MLVDLLCDGSVGTYSVKLASMLGIPCAAYVRCLAGIMREAQRTGDVSTADGTFAVDRDWVSQHTAVDCGSQLSFDASLEKIGVLRRSSNSQDRVSLDVNLLASMSSGDDVKAVTDISKAAGLCAKRSSSEAKKYAIADRLKSGLVCSNSELLNALSGWIDSILATDRKPLSKEAVRLFQDGVNNYAKGDLDTALAVVKVATVQSYRNSDWAINSYEKEIGRKSLAYSHSVRHPARSAMQRHASGPSDLSPVTF